MISYVIVAAGAFGMILLLALPGFRSGQDRGFPRTQCAQVPWFAGMMAILMFSLAGPAAVHRILGQARRHPGRYSG